MASSHATELTGAQSARLAKLEAKYGSKATRWMQHWFGGDPDQSTESFDWWLVQAHTAGSMGEFAG